MIKLAKIICSAALSLCIACTPLFSESDSTKYENTDNFTLCAHAEDEVTKMAETMDIYEDGSDKDADEEAENAENEAAEVADVKTESTEKENTDSEASAESSEDNTDNENGSDKDADEENLGGEGMSEENAFDKIYATVMEHISELLSLAAFIGSLICAIIYKSGLLPLMENGLTGLKAAAIKIKEATDKAECDNKISISSITEKIEKLESAIIGMEASVADVRNSLATAGEQRVHEKNVDTLLRGELDMLYDIFMSSALPEYEKARVGERVAKLKEGLIPNETEK